LPQGAEEIALTDLTGIDDKNDCVVLKLRNLGMINLELIYMPEEGNPFEKIKDSLVRDAESIGALVANVNSDSSEFSMETNTGSDSIVHHHLLFKQDDFVFSINFFKNFNSEDFSDIKTMAKTISLTENAKKSSSFVAGQRIPIGSVHLHN